MFILINNPAISKTPFVMSLEGVNFIKGGKSALRYNLKNDVDAYNNDEIVDALTLSIPDGQTETEFDLNIIQAMFDIFPLFENSYPSIVCNLAECEGAMNSNTFIDMAVHDAGGEILPQFENTPLQKSQD